MNMFSGKETGMESEIRRVIRPMESAVSHLPKILRDSSGDAICSGASLAVPGITSLDLNIVKGDLVALFTLKGELVALAKAEISTEEILKSSFGLAATPTRVMMKIETSVFLIWYNFEWLLSRKFNNNPPKQTLNSLNYKFKKNLSACSFAFVSYSP